jgi:DNA-binding NarL/FixJ family response regulator
MKQITVLLADDSATFRSEMKALLESEADLKVVGEASNGRSAVSMAKEFLPDLVLMDTSMPIVNGLQATREILKCAPATKVLMLSAHRDEAYVDIAVSSGARGYLLKQNDIPIVCTAIRAVHQGVPFFSPSVPRYSAKAPLRRRRSE